jgi:hypothetical protein
MTKDKAAAALIDKTIREEWPDIVESVSVTPRIDFLDEPAFDVMVGLKSIEQAPSPIVLSHMLARLGDVLKDIGDERSTHMGFSAPDEVFDNETDDEEVVRGFDR